MSPPGLQLIQQLREHPELIERFRTILKITANIDGPVKRADEVEALLIEEMRRLGNAGRESWAARAENTLSEQLKQKAPSAVGRKRMLRWWRVFGALRVTERVWHTEQQGYVRLFPTAIGISPRGRFQRLERLLTDFGREHSFQHAATRVLEHYSFEINASAVRNARLQHAHRAGQILQQEYEQPFRAPPATGVAQMVAEADGSMVCTVAAGPRKGKRPRDGKEIRLTAAQALGRTETFYAATFGQVDEAGRRWGHCARRAGWGLHSQIHALGDRAEWIRRQTREVFGAQGTFLCDYHHVSQYLAEAAPGCRAKAPEQWRRNQQARLKRGALEEVIEGLAEHLEPSGTPEELTPVTNANCYLTNRTDCSDYSRALRLGLPIGSGMIESGHRHVLQAGLKTSRCRLAGAQCRPNGKPTWASGQ